MTVKTGRLITTIFIFIIIKTLIFVFLIPPWQGPDEPYHFKKALIKSSEATNISSLDRALKKSLKQNRFREYIDYAHNYKKVLKTSDKKMPGYYMILGSILRLFPDESLTGKLFVGRLFSAFCYLMTVILVYLTVQQISAPDNEDYKWICIAALIFVGFHPQLSFFSVTVNSDNLIFFLLTLCLFCMTRLSLMEQNKSENSFHKYSFLIIALSAVLVSVFVKRSGAVTAVFFCASFFLIYYKDRKKIYFAAAIGFVSLCIVMSIPLVNKFIKSKKQNKQLTITFDNKKYKDASIGYQAYDINSKREVALLINGQRIHRLKPTAKNAWGKKQVIIIPRKYLNDNDINQVTFKQKRRHLKRRSQFKWGVRNITINGELKYENAYGNLPASKTLKTLYGIPKKIKLRIINMIKQEDVKYHVFVRYVLVQFVSFWFSLGWMVFKLSPPWYLIFGIISLLSFTGIIRFVICHRKHSAFHGIDLKCILLLLLLFFSAQLAMLIAFGPISLKSVNEAMGRCRFMEIGAVSILIPLGIWAVSPISQRVSVIKIFSCFMIFINFISIFKYIIPIFYL